MMNMREHLQLAKTVLCLLIGSATVFGAILAKPNLSWALLFLTIGITTLAMGAATLNSFQERCLDQQMLRTSRRPLPKNLISIKSALYQSVILLIVGLSLVFFSSDTVFPVLTAIFAVVLYNAVYTPLKQKTVLAIVPGAICGAMPPYIGWLAAGGKPFAYGSVLIIVLFILWQIPHFWLVMLSFKQDYLKSNQPNLLKQIKENRLKRFFITWIGAQVVVMLLFLILPLQLDNLFKIAIVFNAILLLVLFICGLGLKSNPNYKRLFKVLNGTLFVHMALLTIGTVIA